MLSNTRQNHSDSVEKVPYTVKRNKQTDNTL